MKAKRITKTTLNVNTEAKKIAEDFITNFTFNSSVNVTNDVEHKLAIMLIEQGVAEVISKKNYGRISSIRRV